jgi:hypothetical protein
MQPHQSHQKIGAYIAILQQWNDMMRQRQRTQAIRRVSDVDVLSRCSNHLAFEQINAHIPVQVAGIAVNTFFALLKPVVIGVQRTTEGVSLRCNA